jgi:hypothetical protein
VQLKSPRCTSAIISVDEKATAGDGTSTVTEMRKRIGMHRISHDTAHLIHETQIPKQAPRFWQWPVR